MKFTTAAAAFALSGAAMALPTSSRSESTTYQIKDFGLRKLNGKDINTVYFNIVATNGGSLDFECSAYDAVKGGATDNFEIGKVYSCGENSLFSFSYIPKHDDQTNELFLWQNVSENETLGGNVFFDDPICHAGGSSQDDLVCSIPPQVYVAVTMEKLGA